MSDDEQRLAATRAALDKISPTMCLAKWLQVTLYLKQGHGSSCHYPPAHAIPAESLRADPARLHNTEVKLAARRQMLRGERPAECSYCWRLEDLGQTSDRIYKSSFDWAQPHLKQVTEAGADHSIDPTYLEVAFDSVCNFKCIYCTPTHSSSWWQEIKRFGPYPTSQNYHQIHDTHGDVESLALSEKDPYSEAFWHWWPTLSQRLKVFRITGGEPLLISHTWRVLEWLKHEPRPELTLSINSNLGISESKVDQLIENLQQLCDKVKNIVLYVSMDTQGAQAEYIRYGLDYAQFMHHADKILTKVTTPIEFSYMATASTLSVTGFTGFLRDVNEQKRKFGARHTIRVSTTFVRTPSFLSPQILPPEFAHHFRAAAEFMTTTGRFEEEEIDNVRRLVHLMEQPQALEQLHTDRSDFRKMIEEYDRRRGTNFLKTFPEYAGFWQMCTC